MEQRSGTLLAERYELLQLLGEGGMGRVYSARDRELEETVALKLLHPQLENAGALAGLRSEVRLARRVTHPNVARTYDLGVSGDVRFITMELVHGQPLSDFLKSGERLPLPELLRVALEIARGLLAAHVVGIVHRDLKPANVLLSERRVVLTDFGVAFALSDSADCRFVGTPAYMAPEQAMGGTIDGRADVYSLGVVMFRALTGRLPFPRDANLQARMIPPPDVRSINAAVPAPVALLVADALAPVRTSRIDAAKVIARLAAVRGDSVELVTDGGSAASTPDDATTATPTLVMAMNEEAGDLYAEATTALQLIAPENAFRAVDLLTRADALQPNDALIMSKFAMALCRTSAYGSPQSADMQSRAEELALRALAVDPSHGETFHAIGFLRLQHAEYRPAIRAFQAALARDPSLSESHFWLGQIACEVGNVDEGMQHFALARDSAGVVLPRVHGEMARIHALLGDVAGARRELALGVARVANPGLLARLGSWWKEPAMVAQASEQFHVMFSGKARGSIPALRAIVALYEHLGVVDDPDALEAAIEHPPIVLRHHVWHSQLAVELLTIAGHGERALGVIARAVDRGLIDILWMDACPVLAPLRDDPAFARQRARVASHAASLR